MRIGLVLDRYEPSRGGVEQWTHQFAAELVRRGHDVHVVAGGCGPAAAEDGVTAHKIAAGRSRTAFAAAAEERLRSLPLDVIHDMGVGWYYDVLQPHGGSRLAAARQNRLLLPAPLRPLKRLAEACLPRYRDFAAVLSRQYGPGRGIVLALSEMVRRDLCSLHALPDERIRLVYNGVDVERFHPERCRGLRSESRRGFGYADQDVVYLIVAHNLKLKGVPALLRAVARLAANTERPRLLIVGGKRTAAYERLCRRLDIEGNVHFAGPIDDPVPCYAAADVYVQPTYYDPCSLVVLEALACGLPVVTTQFNGAGELISAGREGFVIPDPSDDVALAEAMARFLDAESRERMSHSARRLALRHPFARNVEAILRVYADVLAKKGAGPRVAA